MRWPYRRFLKAYDAFQRRRLCEEWRQRKLAHLAGLHANTNLDQKNVDRAQIMRDVEAGYDELIARIWNDDVGTDSEEIDPDTDDPYLRAQMRQQAIASQRFSMPGESQIAALPG